MNSIIDEMLKNYQTETLDEKKNAVKEIIQEVVLCGLARAKFFQKAAFYGQPFRITAFIRRGARSSAAGSRRRGWW